jgi:hypothetical protein
VPLSMYGYHIFNPAGGISLTLEGFAIWMQTHLNGETSPRLLSKEMFKTLQTPIQSGGVPAFAMGPFALLGRSLSHGGTNGRNSADHLLLMDRGIGVFAAANALPPDNVPSWTLFSSLLMATALPGQWPMPATRPPSPDAGGKIEGEALEFIASSGGGIEFQNIKQLSGGFQLWWRGAKDGDRLTLRLSVPAKGRYVLEGVFAKNRDFGDVLLRFGALEKRLSFRADRLTWEAISLGEVLLDAGPRELVITAHGNAGSDGIVCHLGLDLLRVKPI